MVLLKRSDPAGHFWKCLREVDEGALAGGRGRVTRRRSAAGEMGPQMGLAAMPAGNPPIGRGDGEREPPGVPHGVKWSTLCHLGNQREELRGRDAGVSDQVAPEDGKGPPAPLVFATIGAKKRTRRTSR